MAKENWLQEQGKIILAGLQNEAAADSIEKFLAGHKRIGTSYREALSLFIESGYDYKKADRTVKGIDLRPNKFLAEAAEIMRQDLESKSQLAYENAIEKNNIGLGVWMSAILAFSGGCTLDN